MNMENVLKIHDGRINADNYLFEITIRDYYDIVKDRLLDNEYQRRVLKIRDLFMGSLRKIC